MLTDWATKSMAKRPIEADIVKRVIKALADNGTPVTTIDYGDGEAVAVIEEDDILNEVFNLDEAYLVTDSGAWVRLVMGEGWDALCDYTTSLDKPIEPIMQWIMRNS